MDCEFETKRTGLANAFADAGKDLLDYMGTGAALAAIPNTEPQQYVVAGTLPMIAKMLPGVEPTSPAVAPSQVPAELTVERIDALWRHSCEVGGETTREYVRHFAKAVATEVRLSAVREARIAALEEAAQFLEMQTGYTEAEAKTVALSTTLIRHLKRREPGFFRAKAEAPAASKEGGASHG